LRPRMITGILLALVLLFALSGLTMAQSPTYAPEPHWPVTTPPLVPPPPDPIDPDVPPAEPDVPADWIRMNILDKDVLNLDLCPTSGTLTAIIPPEIEPYQEIRWQSEDTSIATVTPQEPQTIAVVNPVGLGSTWVMVIVTTADATYYDLCLVHVKPCPDGVAGAGVATPPTSGILSTASIMFFGLFLMMAALPVAHRVRKQS